MEVKPGKSTIIKFGDVQFALFAEFWMIWGYPSWGNTQIHSIGVAILGKFFTTWYLTPAQAASHGWQTRHMSCQTSTHGRITWKNMCIYIYLYALNMKCMYYIICVCLDQCRNTVHVRICLSGLISDYICHMELVGASVITFHRNVGMCTRIDARTCVGWNFLDQMPGYCKYHEICQIKCQYILQTHEICQIKRDSWCQEICPNMCVCVRVNLHMFEHVYTYIHMSDCISEHMSNVRPDRCGNTWKGKRPNYVSEFMS
jgi:hypothetical protein